MKKGIKILSVVLVLLLLTCAGLLIWAFNIYKKTQEDPGGVFSGKQGGITIDDAEAGAKEYQKTQKLANILLLGVDTSSEREEQHLGYRSDMMVLCTFNFEDNTLTMISIPRDTRTKMNKLNRDTGEVTGTTTNKINAAYGFGGGPNGFGAKNAMDCVEELLSCDGKFDIEIDNYISVDLEGIPKIVDALDGIEVTLDRNLSGIGKKGQTVTLKAKTADEYLRNRHTGGGDDGRSERQMDFLMAMASKIKAMGAKESAARLFNEFTEFMDTDLTLEQVLALASFVDGFDMSQLQRYRATGSGLTINGTWFYDLDMDYLSNYVLNTLYDEKLPN